MANITWSSVLHLCFLLSLVNAEDFYKLLGVSRRATNKEIKKAYRKKSLEFHPDKNKEEGASDKFAAINQAYEALIDEEKRQIYDRYGEEGLKQHEKQGGGGGGYDPFDQFFNRGHQRRDQEQRTPNVDIPLELTLEEIYSGATFYVSYIRQVLCFKWEMCMKTAHECVGPGIKVQRVQVAPGFVQQVQQYDDQCVARGKKWQRNCSECQSQTEAEKIELTVDVTKGIRPGEAITFEETADEKPGFKAGDLRFIVTEQSDHPVYHREGDNLYMTKTIPLVDALTGFSMTLNKLDGTPFSFKIDDIVQCDEVMRIPGKGMPRRSGRGYGDLFITFEVDFPDELSPDQKKNLRELLGGTSSNKAEHGDEL